MPGQCHIMPGLIEFRGVVLRCLLHDLLREQVEQDG